MRFRAQVGQSTSSHFNLRPGLRSEASSSGYGIEIEHKTYHRLRLRRLGGPFEWPRIAIVDADFPLRPENDIPRDPYVTHLDWWQMILGMSGHK